MMWLFFWIIKAIPATFWLLLAISGTAVFFAAGILGKLPPFKAYTFWIKPLAVIAAVLGIFMYGGATLNDHYQTMIKELEARVKVAEEKSAAVNTVIEERVKVQTKVIRDTQVVYQDRIIESAGQIDSQCKLDPSVPQIHNDAATYPLKDAAKDHNKAAGDKK